MSHKDAEPIIPPDLREKPRRPVNSNVGPLADHSYATPMGKNKMRKLRAERRRAEEEKLNTFLTSFRLPDSGPVLPGEWACPICGQIGRVSHCDEHIAQEHPAAAWGVKAIEREMKPRVIRPVIFPGGAPGGGKRR